MLYYNAIISAGLLGFLNSCAYDPATGGYYSSSNSYYGPDYRQNPSYGNPGYGYSSNGYSGYQESPYGYSGNQQRPYCPDDDD